MYTVKAVYRECKTWAEKYCSGRLCTMLVERRKGLEDLSKKYTNCSNTFKEQERKRGRKNEDIRVQNHLWVDESHHRHRPQREITFLTRLHTKYVYLLNKRVTVPLCRAHGSILSQRQMQNARHNRAQHALPRGRHNHVVSYVRCRGEPHLPSTTT